MKPAKTVTFKLDPPVASSTPRKAPKKGALKHKTASHDAKSHLAQRPYLSKAFPSPQKASHDPAPAAQSPSVQPTRPTDEATIQWGQKLGSLDDGIMDKLAT